jgi:hypothetical protein
MDCCTVNFQYYMLLDASKVLCKNKDLKKGFWLVIYTKYTLEMLKTLSFAASQQRIDF